MHPLAVNPSKIAFTAYTAVARYFGFLYAISRYTFSPPLLGNMVPNSSHMNSPQNAKTNPSTQTMSDAPMEPTPDRMDDGVEKISVPMIRPMMRSVHDITPRCRPRPPAASATR